MFARNFSIPSYLHEKLIPRYAVIVSGCNNGANLQKSLQGIFVPRGVLAVDRNEKFSAIHEKILQGILVRRVGFSLSGGIEFPSD